MAPKPSPVPKEVVCSVCGLDWARHNKATLAECIELLKCDLDAEKRRTAPRPYNPFVPYVPQPRPVYPAYPYYWTTSAGTSGGTGTVKWTSNQGGIGGNFGNPAI